MRDVLAQMNNAKLHFNSGVRVRGTEEDEFTVIKVKGSAVMVLNHETKERKWRPRSEFRPLVSVTRWYVHI